MLILIMQMFIEEVMELVELTPLRASGKRREGLREKFFGIIRSCKADEEWKDFP